MSGKQRGKTLLKPAELLSFQPHTRHKLAVHEKYLRACLKFPNFCYIDTHGGTGLIKINNQVIEGSAIRAAALFPSAPLYVIEIDARRVQRLRLVAKEKNLTQLKIIEGDCNAEVPRLLKEEIKPGQMFVLFFVDPDRFIYRDRGKRVLEVTPNLLDTITAFPRSEILFTLIIQGIRPGAYAFKRPFDPKSTAMTQALEGALGVGLVQWLKDKHLIPLHHVLLDWVFKKYLKTPIKPRYKYVGALIIKNPKNVPQYYLVFGTNNQTGAKIMRDIMKKEWEEESRQKNIPLLPLELFIFDDRLQRPSLWDILRI